MDKKIKLLMKARENIENYSIEYKFAFAGDKKIFMNGFQTAIDILIEERLSELSNEVSK